MVCDVVCSVYEGNTSSFLCERALFALDDPSISMNIRIIW